MFGFLKKLLGGGSTVQRVTPQEAQQLVGSGAIMLDVREASEREAAHIAGSRHIPLSQLAGQSSSLPKDKIIICQCASGRRSLMAAQQLAAQGFDVCNLQGGIVNWQNTGLPTK